MRQKYEQHQRHALHLGEQVRELHFPPWAPWSSFSTTKPIERGKKNQNFIQVIEWF